MPIAKMKALIELVIPDKSRAELIWNSVAVAESLEQFAKLQDATTGYVYVDRDRGLKEDRRETQGILDGGEQAKVPRDKITIFMLRTLGSRNKNPAWWPQIRFPDGRYAFAFSV